MKEKLKLTLTIGGGVFLGLLAMRIASGAYRFADDRDLLPVATVSLAVLAAALLLFLAWRRVYPSLGERGKKNARYFVIGACFFAFLAISTGIALRLMTERVEADEAASRALRAAQYQASLNESSTHAGEEELQKSYLDFKEHNADYEGTFPEFKEAVAQGLLPQYRSLRKDRHRSVHYYSTQGYYTEKQIKQIALKDPACR